MEYTKGRIVEGKIIHVAENYILVQFPNKEKGILRKQRMSPQHEATFLITIKEIKTFWFQ